MRFTFALSVLIAVAMAAPAPLMGSELERRATPFTSIFAILEFCVSGLRGGRGTRGGHPTFPLPPGTTVVKPTTLPPTTLPATTLPATTISATVIGTSTIPATTLSATVLPPTTLPASTISGTTIVISSSSSVSNNVGAVTSSSAPASSSVAATPVLDCVVDATPLPSGAEALPTPTGTFVGSFTGVGTQNYNCSTGDASAAPSAIGANADLTGVCGTGVHSFDNPTSPRFNMDKLGNTLAAKLASVASPDGTNNVAWLNLNAVSSTGGIVQVYRVNTQGGVPPTTCGNATGTIKVNYQATYFFYQS